MKQLRKIAQWTFIILLFTVLCYYAIYARSHPEYFLYTDKPIELQDYTGGAPKVDCESYSQLSIADLKGKVVMNECIITNIPVGSENAYVRKDNAFITFIGDNQLWLGIILIIIVALLFGFEIKEKIDMIAKNDFEEVN
jgi:hypothetical protein